MILVGYGYQIVEGLVEQADVCFGGSPVTPTEVSLTCWGHYFFGPFHMAAFLVNDTIDYENGHFGL